jgi:hypothetical protein
LGSPRLREACVPVSNCSSGMWGTAIAAFWHAVPGSTALAGRVGPQELLKGSACREHCKRCPYNSPPFNSSPYNSTPYNSPPYNSTPLHFDTLHFANITFRHPLHLATFTSRHYYILPPLHFATSDF